MLPQESSHGGCSKTLVLFFFYKPSSQHRVPGSISWRAKDARKRGKRSAKGLHTYLIMSRPIMKDENENQVAKIHVSVGARKTAKGAVSDGFSGKGI